jgi:hypothetical protein
MISRRKARKSSIWPRYLVAVACMFRSSKWDRAQLLMTRLADSRSPAARAGSRAAIPLLGHGGRLRVLRRPAGVYARTGRERALAQTGAESGQAGQLH